MRRVWTWSFCGVAAVLALSAQETGHQLAFDVASVRVADPRSMFTVLNQGGRIGRKGGPGTSQPGRVTYTLASILDLLTDAWGVEDYRILGPDWLKRGGRENLPYNVIATMPPNTTKPQFQLMLQTLLTERFQIRLHHETRTFPGYELRLATGGSKLKPTAHPDDEQSAEAAKEGHDPDGFPFLPPGRGVGVRIGIGVYAKFQNYSVSDFAKTPQFQSFVRDAAGTGTYHIVDKTGLTGQYDFALKFDNRAAAAVVGPRLAENTPPESHSPGGPGSGLPGFFKALEQQLGLKLEKVKAVPLDAIVIDHIEKLSLEN